MDTDFQYQLAQYQKDRIADASSFSAAVQFTMLTGTGGGSLRYVDDEVWSSGTTLTYDADVAERRSPRVHFDEGGQRGDRYGRGQISSEAAGTGTVELAEEIALYQQKTDDDTVRYRPVVTVGGEHVEVLAVVPDRWAECVVFDYRIPAAAKY